MGKPWSSLYGQCNIYKKCYKKWRYSICSLVGKNILLTLTNLLIAGLEYLEALHAFAPISCMSMECRFHSLSITPDAAEALLIPILGLEDSWVILKKKLRI